MDVVAQQYSLRIDSWNVQGKALGSFLNWLDLTDPCSDVFALQEVGGLHRLGVLHKGERDSLTQYDGSEAGVAGEFLVFGCHALSSHLGQAILLDRDSVDYVVESHAYSWMISVTYIPPHTEQSITVVSVHLPHTDKPDDEFDMAVQELRLVSQQLRSSLCMFIGDFNAESGSPRGLQIADAMSEVQFVPLYSGCPTRFGAVSASELDYAFVSKPYVSSLVRPQTAPDIQVFPETRHELSTDHALVRTEGILCKSCLGDRPKKARKRRRRRCTRWSVCKEALDEQLPGHLAQQPPSAAGQWEQLCHISQTVSSSTPSRKYRDSPFIKELCWKRRMCTDPSERTELTRRILFFRGAAKIQWLRDLEAQAKMGDAGAIRFLRQRQKPKGSFDDLVHRCGGQDAAAKHIQQHFQGLFAPEQKPEEVDAVATYMNELQIHAQYQGTHDFSEEEVGPCIEHMHLGKVAGLSGISVELIKAIWNQSSGKTLLLNHLNTLHRTDSLPEPAVNAYIALLPKRLRVLSVDEIRPIHLIESITKLYCSVLSRRLQTKWSLSPVQLGGAKGTQALDALSAAHWHIDQQARARKPGVWLNADIAGAFDHVSHLAVVRFVIENTPDEQAHEALQLLRVVLSPSLHFEWRHERWCVAQKQGVQQGHSYSAALFSFVLGVVLDKIFGQWAHRGEEFPHPSHFGWAYVDDVLMTFKDATQARRLVPELQRALANVGLSLSPTKTQVLVHPDMDKPSDFHDDEFLGQCAWVHETTYLRKTLAFPKDAQPRSEQLLKAAGIATHSAYESMRAFLRGAQWHEPLLTCALLYRYVASTWLWFAPLIDVTAQNLTAVRTLQTTMLILCLQLYIPAEFPHAPAMYLNRLRRRIVLLLLDLEPTRAWTHCWQMRRWTYLAHVFRRPAQNPTRSTLLHFTQVVSRKPGPWSNALSWMYATFYGAFLGSGQSFDTAVANKDLWQQKGLQHFLAQAQTQQHGAIRALTAENWRHPFQYRVGWHLPCLLGITPSEELQITVLDTEDGWLSWTLGSDVPAEFEHWLSLRLMIERPIAVTCFASSDILDSILGDVQSLCLRVWQRHQIVVTFETLGTAAASRAYASAVHS